MEDETLMQVRANACGYRPFYQSFWSSVVRILARQVSVLQARDQTSPLRGNRISQENLPHPMQIALPDLFRKAHQLTIHTCKVSSWHFSVSPLKISNQNIWEVTHPWGRGAEKTRQTSRKKKFRRNLKIRGRRKCFKPTLISSER